MSLLLNMLSRLVKTFLPRSKCLLISWLQSPSAVILEPRTIKSDTLSPSIYHEVMGPDAMILVFWMLSFKTTFSLSSFTFTKRLFSSSLSAIRVVSSAYLRLLIFLLEISWFQLLFQLCPTLCSPVDYSPPCSSVHKILQARILEWVAVPSFRVSSPPRDWTWVSCTAAGFFTTEPLRKP